MSTRCYQLYQRGGPQRRVFLSNFWLKLIRPHFDQPPNTVTFKCSMEMTRTDIKNYLERIYKVKVIDVRTRIESGPTKADQKLGYITKDDDIKYAYITLPQDYKFTFPELCPQEKHEKELKEQDKAIDAAKKEYRGFIERGKDRPGIPNWFTF